MLRYEEYAKEELDACDISDAQKDYFFALGLTLACNHVGK